jgi:Acyl-CoA carboxylase epsilon subunit
MSGSPPDAEAVPTIRVVHGDPTPEELAAVTALIGSAVPAQEPREPAERRGGWADRAAAVRRTPRPGPGAWWASAR